MRSAHWRHGGLNAFGLIDNVQDAIEFRELCEARMPEQSPFWIYAL